MKVRELSTKKTNFPTFKLSKDLNFEATTDSRRSEDVWDRKNRSLVLLFSLQTPQKRRNGWKETLICRHYQLWALSKVTSNVMTTFLTIPNHISNTSKSPLVSTFKVFFSKMRRVSPFSLAQDKVTIRQNLGTYPQQRDLSVSKAVKTVLAFNRLAWSSSIILAQICILTRFSSPKPQSQLKKIPQTKISHLLKKHQITFL